MDNMQKKAINLARNVLFNKCHYDSSYITTDKMFIVWFCKTFFFDQDGIIIEQASLGKVEPDSATKEAIQAVANAQYKQRQAEYEKIAAEAEAKKKVAVAEGDAQAKRIQADAEAYYNAQVASSLTPEMVQLKQVEKWDGKLPTYSGITNGMFSFK